MRSPYDTLDEDPYDNFEDHALESTPGGMMTGAVPMEVDHSSGSEPIMTGYSGGASFLDPSTIASEEPQPTQESRLHEICQMAQLTPEEQARPNMTPVEAAERQVKLVQTWDALREFFVAYPNEADRELAASYVGPFQTTPLHLLCKLSNPPSDVVDIMVQSHTQSALMSDANGWLPLHHACANGASWDVLRLLVQAHPQGTITQDKRLRTPLHFAFFRADASDDADEEEGKKEASEEYLNERATQLSDIVALLSETGAAELADEGGMLPMHYACAYGTSRPVLEVLAAAHPESVAARERKGRTPLHLAMVNAHRSAGPRVVQFILQTSNHYSLDIVDIYDREGNLPIHLLAVTTKLRPDQPEARANVSKCLQLYLDAKPRPQADFLTAVQALPEFLQEVAVVHLHVQKILNDKIVRRFPTSILMLDGYMLIVTIICFQLASEKCIDSYNFEDDSGNGNANNQGELVGCFLGGTYFLVREMVQMISLASLGTFNSWLTDAANWLDVTLIVFVFYYSVLMIHQDPLNETWVRHGLAATKGILWGAVISFLKSTLEDFAVFVNGVIYVVRRLVAFLLALLVILLAFAQIFVIVYTKSDICILVECLDQNATETTAQCTALLNDPDTAESLATCEVYGFPHCKFSQSLLKVYTMLMGEVGNVTRYDTSLVAQIFFIVFAFLVIILLSNVLIAIVTDSYGVIRNDKAAIVFWSNRLDFVAEMDAIASIFVRGDMKKKGDPFRINSPSRRLSHTSSSAQSQGEQSVMSESLRDQQRREMGDAYISDDAALTRKSTLFQGWTELISLFDANLYDDIEVKLGSFEFWCYFLFRFLAITLIIPCWILLGLVTAGWLWPPQVRELLFLQQKSNISRGDILEQVSKQIDQVKTEIISLRHGLKYELRSDRRELVNMKNEIEMVQKSALSDLSQVKEIMTSLLDTGRDRANRIDARAIRQFAY